MTLKSFLAGVANDLETELIRVCPVDKGSLRLSINVELKNDEIIITMLDYWVHLEYGTGAHIIRPKDKKYLKFKGKNGKVVFAKEVHHPGTEPNPFIRNTFYHKLPMIVENNATRHLGDSNAAEVVF